MLPLVLLQPVAPRVVAVQPVIPPTTVAAAAAAIMAAAAVSGAVAAVEATSSQAVRIPKASKQEMAR